MKQPVKEIQAFINYDENVIRDSDDLISFKISCDSGLCKTAMRKLEAQYLGSHNLLGKWVKVGFGVRLSDGGFDLIDYGSFLVTELTETKDTEITSIVAYDKMVNAMTPYQKLDIEYPIDLFTYTQKLCEACNLELTNEYFNESKATVFDNSMWDLSDGAIINANGNLELHHFGSSVTMGLTWDKKDRTLYVQFTLVSGGYYLCHIDCFNENGESIGAISSNSTSTVEDNSLLTVRFGGDDQSGDILQNAKYITLRFYSGPEYASQPYTISNVSVCNPDNFMNDWQITQELWENIEGITYRDIFTQIAQATATTCIIHEDKVYFKPLTDTGENLTYDNLFKLKLEALYGEINSVVLSRAQIEGEIVSLQNDASVQTNGVTEFKIESNEIIDKDRENAIFPIFNALNGVSYYPFEATTEGLGWYEIGDNITIVNDLGEEYKTSLFNYSITIDGSVKETLKATAENKTQSQYQYANTVSKQIRNTEIIVNKQEQTIKAIVSEMDGVNDRFTSIEQDIENINFNVQNGGGSNLIRNSVMFAYETENDSVKSVANWELEDGGTLTIVSDVDLQTSGGMSAHGFSLSNKRVRTEKIPVKPFNENNPVYYSFSTKVKTDSVGGWYVKIYNPDVNEEYTLPLEEVSETSNLVEYELSALKPSGDYYIIEFYGSADSNVIFTDNMLAVGEQKSQWTQANGEVMNTQVNISLDGIVVKSTQYLGSYTVISPVEFSGYADVNGTPTKIFTLNGSITEIRKLLAEEEIAMPPLKIVPVNSGELQGWAFVLA